MAGFDEGAHPRGEGGKFASAGGADHASHARRAARKASKRAKAASEGAETRGDHEGAAQAHQEAAGAHKAAAAAHRTAAEQGSPGERGGNLAQANRHDAHATEHEGAAEHHGDEARKAPEEGGAGGWIAERVKGLTEKAKEAKEGIEKAGETAQGVEDKLLHGDPLEAVKGAAAGFAGRLIDPTRSLALAARAAGVVSPGGGEGEKKEGGKE